MVKTYNKDKVVKISKHYTTKNFQCSCRDCRETPIDDKLVGILEQVAGHFGVAPVVTSGYRCPAENARTPNANPRSYHLKGMAADIVVPGWHPKAVAKYAESIGVYGIGLYDTAKDGYFVHLDARPKKNKCFWKGHAGIVVSTFGGRDIRFNMNIRVLQQGMTGKDVKALQYALAGRGLYNSGFDGIFGVGTLEAVKKFQKAEGLAVDGICGPDTRRKLLGLA